MLNFKRKRVLNPNLIVKFVVLSMLMFGILGTNTGQVNFANASYEEDVPGTRIVEIDPAERHAVPNRRDRWFGFNRAERHAPVVNPVEDGTPVRIVEVDPAEENIRRRARRNPTIRQNAAPTGGNNRNERGRHNPGEFGFNREIYVPMRRVNVDPTRRVPNAAEENAATTNVNTQPGPIDYGEPSSPVEAALINVLRRYNVRRFEDLPVSLQRQLEWELGPELTVINILRRHNVRRFRDLPIPLQRQLEWELNPDLINNIRRNESPAICILANVIVNVISNVASFVQSYFNSNVKV